MICYGPIPPHLFRLAEQIMLNKGYIWANTDKVKTLDAPTKYDKYYITMGLMGPKIITYSRKHEEGCELKPMKYFSNYLTLL